MFRKNPSSSSQAKEINGAPAPETSNDLYKSSKSLAAAEAILRTVEIQERTSKPKRISSRLLEITETVSTVPIPLYPDKYTPDFSFDCIQLIVSSKKAYRGSPLSTLLPPNRYKPDGKPPISQETTYHFMIGEGFGALANPEMTEKVLFDLPDPVITVDHTNGISGKKPGSEVSFENIATQGLAALQSMGFFGQTSPNLAV